MTALLYFEKYGSAFTSAVMSANWPLSPSVRASVNGTSNTVGSVPAASFEAKVGAVHWYSTGFTLIDWFFLSNCATCALNCWVAAGVEPGISDATLIVTVLVVDPTATAAVAHAATTIAAATVVTIRMDFIVLPFLLLRWTWSRPGEARPSCRLRLHPLRARCSRARARRRPGGEAARHRSWSDRRNAVLARTPVPARTRRARRVARLRPTARC